MSLFSKIINGSGNTKFWWEVAIYKGDTETETVKHCDTYLEALIFKLQHKTPEKLLIDLWYMHDQMTQPDLIGIDFLRIKNFTESLAPC